MTGNHEDPDDSALVDALIERSSLGAEGAKQLRERITQSEANLIRQLAKKRDSSEQARQESDSKSSADQQRPAEKADRLLTPGQVATLFHVDPKTITRWAKAGRLTIIRTLGGHRRYRESEVLRLLQSSGEPEPERIREPADVQDHLPDSALEHPGELWQAQSEEAQDEQFDHILFSNGAQKRITLFFLLDTSSSMKGPAASSTLRPIDELNNAVKEWAAHLKSAKDLRYRAELALITFGDGGVTVHPGHDDSPFCPAALFDPPILKAGGVTPMFEAIRTAIDLSERRKAELDQLGIQRFRPLMFMMSDGNPTDSTGHPLPQDEWQHMAAQIAMLEERRKLAFFAVGFSSADLEFLATLAPDSSWQVSQNDLATFLKEASNSAADDDPTTAARARLKAMAMAGHA